MLTQDQIADVICSIRTNEPETAPDSICVELYLTMKGIPDTRQHCYQIVQALSGKVDPFEHMAALREEIKRLRAELKHLETTHRLYGLN